MTREPRPSIGRPVPGLARDGLAIIIVGLLLDVGLHATGSADHAALPAEHLAHAVIVVGMLAVLCGIVLDGVLQSLGRRSRPEGSTSRAHR